MRLSVTALDNYQYFLDSEIDQNEFLQNLTTFKDTRPMFIGLEFERLMQEQKLESEINFDKQDLNRLMPKFQNKIWQVKATKEYETDYGILTLVGKADIVDGNVIIDVKTTANLNFDRYANSWQWRSYLDIFELDAFEYWITLIRDKELVNLSDLEILTFYSYPSMKTDVNNIVNKYVHFLHQTGYNFLLEPK